MMNSPYISSPPMNHTELVYTWLAEAGSDVKESVRKHNGRHGERMVQVAKSTIL